MYPGVHSLKSRLQLSSTQRGQLLSLKVSWVLWENTYVTWILEKGRDCKANGRASFSDGKGNRKERNSHTKNTGNA